MTAEFICKRSCRFDHYARFVLMMFFCLIFSGCCLVNVPEGNRFETTDLEAGEKAFFQKQYKDAAAIFSSIMDRSCDPGVKNTALYNLACTKLTASENEDELIEAMALFDRWNSSKQGKVYFENPLLMVQTLQKITEANKKERLEYLRKTKGLDKIVKYQSRKILEMEQTILTLQHQISELENIDQEIQEKRQTN